MCDFKIRNHGTVWRIEAVSEAARDFAREHFSVEDWQGVPEDFMTDHRPARHLCERLADCEGFELVGSQL